MENKSLKIVRFETDANDLTFLKIKKGFHFTADMSNLEGHIVAFYDPKFAKKLIDEKRAEQCDFDLASQIGYTLFAIVGVKSEVDYLTLNVDNQTVMSVGGSFAHLLPKEYLANRKMQHKSTGQMRFDLKSGTKVKFIPKEA